MIDFIPLPGSNFTMGLNEHGLEPVRQARVNAFSLARTPLTWKDWKPVYDWAQKSGYRFLSAQIQPGGHLDNAPAPQHTPDEPVTRVTWLDAVCWCNAASEMNGLAPVYYSNEKHEQVFRGGLLNLSNACVDWNSGGYRLPTEAEWEYACRTGTSTRFYWGDAFDADFAWIDINSGGTTHSVAQKKPNAFGFYDMLGNIWEWCWDHFVPTEKIADKTDNFKGPDEGDQRVVRGGSFNFNAWHARAAYRTSDRASLVEPWHGLRIAKNN